MVVDSHPIAQIKVTKVVISNFERYSSRIADFVVLSSQSYPTPKWTQLGEFTAEDEAGTQEFDMPKPHFAKFIKILVNSFHGNEFFCTLSEVKVYGTTIVEDLSDGMVGVSDDIMAMEKTRASLRKGDHAALSPPPQDVDATPSPPASAGGDTPVDVGGADAAPALEQLWRGRGHHVPARAREPRVREHAGGNAGAS